MFTNNSAYAIQMAKQFRAEEMRTARDHNRAREVRRDAPAPARFARPFRLASAKIRSAVTHA